MNLRVKGVSFKDLVTLFRNAYTVSVNGKIKKNKFGQVSELNKDGLEGRKAYLEEVVEIEDGKVRVYSEGKLKVLVEGVEGVEESQNYRKLYEEGVIELVTEKRKVWGYSEDVSGN